jgi:lipid-binding SYLF domain-containing protein
VKIMVWMRWLLVAIVLLTSATAEARSERKDRARLAAAIEVLHGFEASSDKRIPERLLRNAEGIAIFPNTVRAGFVLGGQRGKGVVSLRGSDGSWGMPVFINLTGGSIGWQAGVQSSDIILVFKTRQSVQNIANGKFTIGADASVAAGKVGRQANAATDAEFSAEIYAYSRSKGLFAGLAMDGSVLSIDYNANERTYGRDVTPRKVLERGVNDPPAGVVELQDALEEHLATTE